MFLILWRVRRAATAVAVRVGRNGDCGQGAVARCGQEPRARRPPMPGTNAMRQPAVVGTSQLVIGRGAGPTCGESAISSELGRLAMTVRRWRGQPPGARQRSGPAILLRGLLRARIRNQDSGRRLQDAQKLATELDRNDPRRGRIAHHPTARADAQAHSRQMRIAFTEFSRVSLAMRSMLFGECAPDVNGATGACVPAARYSGGIGLPCGSMAGWAISRSSSPRNAWSV